LALFFDLLADDLPRPEAMLRPVRAMRIYGGNQQSYGECGFSVENADFLRAHEKRPNRANANLLVRRQGLHRSLEQAEHDVIAG
jgi:hypothetical protein